MLEVNLGHQAWESVHLVFWDIIFHTGLKLGYLAREVFIFVSPALGFFVHTAMPVFMWAMDKVQVFTPAWQTLHWLSHPLIPLKLFLHILGFWYGFTPRKLCLSQDHKDFFICACVHIPVRLYIDFFVYPWRVNLGCVCAGWTLGPLNFALIPFLFWDKVSKYNEISCRPWTYYIAQLVLELILQSFLLPHPHHKTGFLCISLDVLELTL